MKLSLKKLLFTLFVGLGVTLSSCSNDDQNLPGPDTNPDEELKEGEGYFSFEMSASTKLLLTKADYDGSGVDPALRDAGEPDEMAVQKMLMVFYTKSHIVEKQFIKGLTGGGATEIGGEGVATTPGATAPSKISFVSKAEKLEIDDYSLLVVLNPTDAMIAATTAGKTFSEFDGVKDNVTVADFKGQENAGVYKYIPMTNVAGLVNVTKSQFYGKVDEAEKATNKPKVQVDRMIAKVTFAKGATISYPNGGELHAAKWALDITNKKTYWMRKITYTAPVTGDGTGTGNATDWGYNTGWKHESTFNSTLLRDYIYAEDPNYMDISTKKWDDFVVTPALEANFNYMSTFPATAKTLTTTATMEYTLENTMAPTEQWEDVTTRIIMQGNYAPTGIAANTSYYFFAGYGFTHTQLAEMYNDIVNDNKNKPWPTTPAGLQAAVVKAVNDGDFFGAGFTAPAESKASKDGAISYYKDGISYYKIKVRHFSDQLSMNPSTPTPPDYLMNFGRYGIVRNNLYKVTLTKVSGPGTPTIPKPGGPDDETEGYISADVEILPWVVRNQSAEV